MKGYKLWCTETSNQRVIINRDVVCKEEEMSYLKQEKVYRADGSDSARLKVESGRNDQDDKSLNTFECC